MKPRKKPSDAVAHRIPTNKGAEPGDFFGKRYADAVGSSRMGEINKADRPVTGVGEVRREERKQARIEEGKLNRAFERQMRAKRKEV